jgi:serine/threonine-protein kinase
MRELLISVALAACSSNASGPSGPYFGQPMFFDRDVSRVPASSNTPAIIGALRAAGGWGNGDRFDIDYSFVVLSADASTPRQMFTPNGGFYTPDCDLVPVPIPPGGHVEGEPGYACTDRGDCHLIVFDRDAHELYEMFGADIENGAFSGGCLAVWHLADQYGPTLRGDQCASADAAGFPIAPMLLNADEVASGHVDHAIRFILPDDRLRVGYVRPATHATLTDGYEGAPYYGVQLRLRADFPIDSLPSPGAQVVARALQTYGMYQADGGEIALTAADDSTTTAKWDGLLAATDLEALIVEDFDVIDHGPMVILTGDCMR